MLEGQFWVSFSDLCLHLPSCLVEELATLYGRLSLSSPLVGGPCCSLSQSAHQRVALNALPVVKSSRHATSKVFL